MKNILLFLVISFLAAACKDTGQNTAQGYVEGEYAYMASARAGRLEQLFVSRGDTVKAGSPLFALEAEQERLALAQAEQDKAEAQARLDNMKSGKRQEEIAVLYAQLKQASAVAENAEMQLRRHEKMIKTGGISQRELDESRSAAKSSAARVEELLRQLDVSKLPEREKLIEAQQTRVSACEARMASARWELAQKSLAAVSDALVFDTFYTKGEWVPAGKPIVQLLPENNVKIRFFVPESALSKIRKGESVNVSMDGTERMIQAKITYVSPSAEYTPPIIYSNETRAKLVFMVEAKPDADTVRELHPGQPVSVELP